MVCQLQSLITAGQNTPSAKCLRTYRPLTCLFLQVSTETSKMLLISRQLFWEAYLSRCIGRDLMEVRSSKLSPIFFDVPTNLLTYCSYTPPTVRVRIASCGHIAFISKGVHGRLTKHTQDTWSSHQAHIKPQLKASFHLSLQEVCHHPSDPLTCTGTWTAPCSVFDPDDCWALGCSDASCWIWMDRQADRSDVNVNFSS